MVMTSDLQKLHKVWLASRAFRNTNFTNISYEKLTNCIVTTGLYYYYVIDFYDMSLSNVSSSIQDIHGFDPQTVKFDDVLDTIHPDDIEFVAHAEAFLTKFFYEKLTREKLLSYKMSYCFRSRMKNGEYVMLNHQAIMLSLDENGRSGKSLNIHTRIDHLTYFNTRKVSLIGLNNEPCYMNMSIEDVNSFPNFSRREAEVLKLIALGLSSIEISNKLFVSPFTVKKHRQNISRKTECNNITQLINEGIQRGLI